MNTLTYCKSIPPPNTLDSYNAAIGERPSNATDSNGCRQKRGVGEHTKFWTPGRALKILVYKHDEHSFEAVKKGATKWLPYINLKFDFLEIDEEDIYNSEEFLGDIRVNFQPLFNNSGSSKIGTDALTGSPHDASMYLGTNFFSLHYDFTVVHEFGHALGLHHEHQHPDAKIPWDREKTYAYYARTGGLSKRDVDANVFPLERIPGRTYTPYDRQSVMHYEVLNQLTIGDWHQAASMRISEGDIALVKKAYP
ncbi:M12 family metallopeptidase [Pseudomonas azerbaijanoccidentalis]